MHAMITTCVRSPWPTWGSRFHRQQPRTYNFFHSARRQARPAFHPQREEHMACPICTLSGAMTAARTGDFLEYGCPVCGDFRATDSAAEELKHLKEEERFILSGVTRTASEKGHRVKVTAPVRAQIDSAPVWTSLFDGVDLLILFLASRSEGYG